MAQVDLPYPADQFYRRLTGTEVTSNLGTVPLSRFARSASCGRDARASVQIPAVLSYLESRGYDLRRRFQTPDEPLHHNRVGAHQSFCHMLAHLRRQIGVLPYAETIWFRVSSFVRSGCDVVSAVVTAASHLFRGKSGDIYPIDPSLVRLSFRFSSVSLVHFRAHSDCLWFLDSRCDLSPSPFLVRLLATSALPSRMIRQK